MCLLEKQDLSLTWDNELELHFIWSLGSSFTYSYLWCSDLDYCNSLLFVSLPCSPLNSVFHTAKDLILVKMWEDVSPLSHTLQWLPLQLRGKLTCTNSTLTYTSFPSPLWTSGPHFLLLITSALQAVSPPASTHSLRVFALSDWKLFSRYGQLVLLLHWDLFWNVT